jgi:hypothetical protein
MSAFFCALHMSLAPNHDFTMTHLQRILDIHHQQLFVKAQFSFDTHPTVLVRGTAIRFILEILGHGSAKTTAMYTQVSEKSLANIKSPLDHVIEQQSDDNEHTTKLKA